MRLWLLTCLLLIISLPLSSTEKATKNNKFTIRYSPQTNTLDIIDKQTSSQLKSIPLIDKLGHKTSVAGIADAYYRHSFIVALKGSPEVWEINYENPPPAGFGSWVHDYRKESGEAVIKLFPIRRIRLLSALDNIFLDEKHINLASVSCKGEIQIIDLDLGKKIVQFRLFKKNKVSIKHVNILQLDDQFIQRTQSKACQIIHKQCQQNPCKSEY